MFLHADKQQKQMQFKRKAATSGSFHHQLICCVYFNGLVDTV